jgi:hypothetical protein
MARMTIDGIEYVTRKELNLGFNGPMLRRNVKVVSKSRKRHDWPRLS